MAESFLFNSLPLQAGHAGAGEELRTSTSNSLPQEAHWYSYMGMNVLRRYELNLGPRNTGPRCTARYLVRASRTTFLNARTRL